MSRPFKLGLIVGAVCAVLAIVVDVATGGTFNVGLEVAIGLIVFGITFLISFVIFRVVGVGKKRDDEYEYEYEDD